MITKLSKVFKGLFSQSEVEIANKTNEIVDYINSNFEDGKYRIYQANLSQNGSNPPSSIILKNTLGYEPSLNRSGVSDYTVVLDSSDSGKNIFFNLGQPAYDGLVFASASSGVVYLKTYSLTSGLSDGILNNTFIEIRVPN